jgi:hypothetical protein
MKILSIRRYLGATPRTKAVLHPNDLEFILDK